MTATGSSPVGGGTPSSERLVPADPERAADPALWRDWLPLAVYHLIFGLIGLVLAPVVLWRALRDPEARQTLAARLGLLPRTLGDRRVVWFHGVSVGEVKGLQPLVERVARLHPDLEILVSSTTPTGHALARELYAAHRVVHYPIDFWPCPGRALDRIRPCCVLLMELEIWPTFLHAAAKRGVPVVVVNGRISERSFRGYRVVRRILPQFGRIRRFCVQNQTYLGRLLELGVQRERVVVTGNLKYDSVPLGREPEAGPSLRAWLESDADFVVVAGSTHPREERWLADAMREVERRLECTIRLVLVPRHPGRAEELSAELRDAGYEVVRWTQGGHHRAPLAAGRLVLIDAIGLLEGFYAACDLAFVGGSLVPHGGQNMLEPAALGRAVVFGPHIANFRVDVENLLQAEAAVQIEGIEDLPDVLEELLRDPGRRARLGARAVELIRANQGAVARTHRLIEDLLEVPDGSSGGDRSAGARPAG